MPHPNHLLLGLCITLFSCNLVLSPRSSSSISYSHSHSTSTDWRANSRDLQEWVTRPVWTCFSTSHPNDERHSMMIRFDPSGRARVRIMPLEIFNAQASWTYEPEILHLQIYHQVNLLKPDSAQQSTEHIRLQHTIEIDTINLDFWWDFHPLNSPPLDSLGLVQLDAHSLEWQCGAQGLFD